MARLRCRQFRRSLTCRTTSRLACSCSRARWPRVESLKRGARLMLMRDAMRRPGRPTRAGAQLAGRPKRICTTGSSRFRTSTCRGAKRTCEECATMHDRFDDSIAAAENWVSVVSSDCAALSSPRCSRPPTPDIFQRSRAAAHPFEYQGHEAFVASQQVRCSRGRLPRRQSQLPKVCAPHRPAFRRVNASLCAKAPPAAGSGPVAWVLPPSPHPTRFVTILGQ